MFDVLMRKAFKSDLEFKPDMPTSAPGIKIELELKPEMTTQDIKNWFVWESARIRKSESYPSLIYIAFLDFLFANKHITAKEALRIKITLGQVIARRRQELKLNTVQLAQVAGITQPQVKKLERGIASISAYGGIFISLETYALFKGFENAVERMQHLVSYAPDMRVSA